MENPILISNLNDFVFCPISIYYHNLYGDLKKTIFQSEKQINGTNIHEKVDIGQYSTSKKVLQAIDIYCEKYNIIGKIDCFDVSKGVLTERKKKVSHIYDGYIFQVYAQYFALEEMGYHVKKIVIYSYDDNKSHNIQLPTDDKEMLDKFEALIKAMNSFDMYSFIPTNIEKCKQCIYGDLCDRSLV